MKIVINARCGGFGLSAEGRRLYRSLATSGDDYDYPARNSLALVAAVEQLGAKANGPFASLKIVDIPDDVAWTIEDYDGQEWVSESHRVWE